jgi:ketosteroid isomerase-like protein
MKWVVLSVLCVLSALLWGGQVCAQAQGDLKAMLNPPPGIYVNAWPGFTVSYPKEWVIQPIQGLPEFRVGAPRPPLPPSPGLEVTVGPPSVPLDKEAGSLAAWFGQLPFAKDVKVVSDKPTQLKDGAPAQEVEIEWVFAQAGVKINSLFLVTRKDDVGIWVDIYHDQGKIADDLKSILYSLKLQPSTQGVVKAPPDVEQFLTDWGAAFGSRNVDRVMTYYADQYLHYGRNKQAMAQTWTQVFAVLGPKITFCKASVAGFALDGDKAYVTGFHTDDYGKHPWASPEVLIKENGQWKWYGNQVAGWGAVRPPTATPKDYSSLQGGKWEICGFTNLFGQQVDLSLKIDQVEGDKLAGTFTRSGQANDVTPFSAQIGTAPDGNPGFMFNGPGGSLVCSLQDEGHISCSNGATLKRMDVPHK